MKNKLCFDVKELQNLLGVSRSIAYALVNDPSFYPSFRLGAKLLIRSDLFEQWLDEQTSKEYDLYAAIDRAINMYIKSRHGELPMLSVDKFKEQIMDIVDLSDKCEDPRLNAITGSSMFVKAAAYRIMKEETP